MKFNNVCDTGNEKVVTFLKKATFRKEIIQAENRELFDNFIIYGPKKGKQKQKAYCTSCDKYFEGGPFTRKEKYKCPHCHQENQALPKGNSAWYQKAITGLSFAHKGGVAIVYCFVQFEYGRWGMKRFDDNKIIEKDYSPCQVHFFDSKGHEQYRLNYSACYGPWGWYSETGLHAPNIGGMWNYQKPVCYLNLSMLHNALERSYLKRCRDVITDMDEELELGPSQTMAMMEKCRKYPKLEMLYKNGFYKVVACAAKGGAGNAIYWPGKTLESFFKIKNRNTIKMLGKLNPSINALTGIQLAEKQGWTISNRADVELITSLFCAQTYKSQVEPHGGTVKEFVKWQGKLMENRESRTAENIPSYIYGDYIRQANELGYNLHDKYYLFPANLKEAHDRVSKEYTRMKDKIEKQKRKAEAAEFDIIIKKLSQYEYGDKNLQIRPTRSYDELSREGKALHHCVASYYDRMLKGKTTIFVIRQTASPDEPFYTLELSLDKHIIQCRGKTNCAMTPEVERFLEAWKMYIARADRKQKKKTLTYELSTPAMAAM